MTEHNLEQIHDDADSNVYYFPILGGKILDTEVTATYDDDLAVAQADFDLILKIPQNERTDEEQQRYINASLIISEF